MRGSWRNRMLGLAAVLLLALPLPLPFPAAMAETEEPSPYVYYEDFSSYAVNSYPTSLSSLTSQTNYAGSVVEDAQSLDKSFRIEKTAATTVSAYAGKTLGASEALERATVEVRARAEQTNLISFIAVLRGDSNVITQLAFYSDGNIKAFADTGWVTVASYAPNVWYDFKIVADAGTQTFDIYVDDQLLAVARSFRTAQTDLRQWQAGLYSGSAAGAMSIDEVRISETPPVEAAVGFEEDFETQPLDQYPASFDGETAVAGYQALTTSASGEAGRFLKLERSGASTASYYAYKTLESPLGSTRLSFRASVAQTDAIAYVPVLRGPGGAIAQLAFYNNGTIRVYQGGWITLISEYEANRWYRFDLVADPASQTFAVFIDGKMIGDGYAFQSQQEEVTRIGFGLYKGDGAAALSVDDIRVSPYEFEPVQAVGLTAGTLPLPLAVGSEEKLELEVLPASALFYEVAWSSSDAATAAVDAAGVVRGIQPGAAVITAQVTDSVTSAVYSATRSVNVYYQPATGVKVSPVALTLPVGAEETLTATVLPANASDTAVVWSSSNETVAEVSVLGTVYAKSPGTAAITATTADGNHSDVSSVTVEARTTAYQWYVDPELGNDANAGSEAAPFRTLTKARDAFRSATANGSAMAGDADIILRGGLYELSEPLLLDERDSSDAYERVTYKAYPNEEPIVSGGVGIAGWQLYDAVNGIYRAPSNGIETRQLYVNGIRAVRARSEGPLTEATLTSAGVRSSDTDMATWSRLDELEFVFRERWTQPRAKVQSATLGEGGTSIEFTMQQPGWQAINAKGSSSVTRGPVYVENAYELLDQEGEWYADEAYFYYKPRAFENMATADVTAPVLEELIRIEGSSLGARAGYISFEGITFAYTTWLWPSTSYGLSDVQNNHLRYPGQDDRLIEAAVTVRKAHHIVFEGNTFKHIGDTALKLIDGVQDSLVNGNRLYDISGGAINVGEPTANNPAIYAPKDSRLVMRNVDVTNNYIHDIGVDYASAAAISAGFPVDMEISRNHIFNIPYSGIHVGYGWYSFVSAGQKQVRIENNYIHDLMGAGIYDGGAIYTLGYTGASAEEMNTVSGNYIQNQLDKWAAIYADNASDYWEFRDNVIDQTETPMWGESPAYWAFGKEEELLFDHNYTTTEHVNTSFGAPLRVTNTQVYPDADWPTEARQLIADAGLSNAYRSLYELGAERVDVTEELALEVEGTASIALSATTNKGELADLSEATIDYRSRNPAVATVSAGGVVEAMAHGRTAIETRIVQGDLLWTFETEVYVGDTVVSIELRNVSGSSRKLLLGETFDPGVYGVTDLGREVAFADLSIVSSDSGVVSVQPNGSLLAAGEGEASVTLATYGTPSLSRTIDLEVIQYSSEEGLLVPPYSLNDALADSAGWKVSSGTVAFENGSVRLTTPSGQGYYDGQAFGDELLAFDMTIEAEAGWEVIEIRNQNLAVPLDTAYAVVIKPNEIELQRFNNGVRTVIFGNVTGYTSQGGEAYPNDVLPFGVRKRVQVGAINEANGVRIVLNIDGENVFYYLDKDADRIESDGCFSVMARYGSVRIGPTEE
ncbi:Ig-like domain-containing protein [Cohnella fermenti]|uniref:BIG2 domain-containing protein n=1 Tax=Cohnella fermenti TaxID=2565925 RepID=A0A4S4BRH8_9BACL|nr:Ig-like domain-containing protein [Cohnella fermenti]THF77557.1 hypothetical protein E6C55_16200 [Cohnella fermenti]